MKKIYLIILLLFSLSIVFSFLFQKEKSCYEKIETLVDGYSMSPLLEDGEKIEVLQNYYECHAIQRGDVVIYQSAGRGQLVKQVQVLPGDMVGIDFEKGNLKVNGQYLLSPRGKEYSFTWGELNFMNLYVENGQLKDGNYFIFGTSISGGYDSRKFAGVQKETLIGKVIFKQSQ